ncbi:MAG TPA: Ada metal-binding domain-containing protein [Opitutus sp.]|nr:Ada metal-binding domain-containing protein [Opitutus sp.]
MYDRFVAGDPEWNGRFFTGVLTTGIYCLPSCKARKPKRENVRFFPSCEAARAAGLRACKKCHPDDFARGADPLLETIEALVAEVRADPGKFRDARAIVQRSGFGVTRAFELFRQHYHRTPAEVLLHARIDVAKRELVTSERPLSAIAFNTGFESLSTFHENFRRLNGLTPVAYRALRNASSFTVTLPDGYPLPYLRRALSRDIHSVSERLNGDTYTAAVQLKRGPALIKLQLAATEVQVEVISQPNRSSIAESSDRLCIDAHAVVIGWLGLDQDAAGFARLARKLGLARLVAGRPEFRITRTSSVFDGLLWSIIGQQINFTFACLLKRRLVERAGSPVEMGLVAPPRPEQVAALEISDLLPLQFSRQKAAYVTAIARMIVDGKLDLVALTTLSATRVERTLLSIHGLGPWSVNYLMMRALNFSDCVPLGDTGITSGLQSLLKLEERPDIDATRRLMAMFSPYRSLATAHLWQFNQPFPT